MPAFFFPAPRRRFASTLLGQFAYRVPDRSSSPSGRSNIEVLWTNRHFSRRVLRPLLAPFDQPRYGPDRLGLPDLARTCGLMDGRVLAVTYPARTAPLGSARSLGEWLLRITRGGAPRNSTNSFSTGSGKTGWAGRTRSLRAEPRTRRPRTAMVGAVPAHVGKPGGGARDVPHELRRRCAPRPAGHPCSLAAPECRWRPGHGCR